MRAVSSLALAALLLSGCAVQRATTAAKAKGQMVGMPKEQVLACMGPPTNRLTEGATEVWSYRSGGSADGVAFAPTSGFAFGRSHLRNCTVNIVMSNGHVTRVNYLGNTGAPLAKDEQCAYAVDSCVEAWPPASPSAVGGQARQGTITAPLQPSAAVAPPSIDQRLATLKDLADRKLITPAEHEAKRKEILGGL